MKIGLGGESNWTAHTESAAHRKNEASKSRSTSAKSSTKLTSFFKKKLPESSPILSSITAPSLLPNTLSMATITSPSFFSGLSQASLSSAPHIHVVDTQNDEPIVIDSDGSPPPPPTSTTITLTAGTLSTTSLLSELERMSVSLPLSIPEGTEMDVLARFSGNPVSELEAGQDGWEMADRVLNGAIGYGKTIEDIAKIIRRGPLGMDGLCKWLRVLVSELQVDESLLEGKVNRLIGAMVAV